MVINPLKQAEDAGIKETNYSRNTVRKKTRSREESEKCVKLREEKRSEDQSQDIEPKA